MFCKRLLEIVLLPPAAFLWLLLLGTALRRRWPRFGRALQLLAILQLWTLSTPAVGGALLRALQPYPPLPATGTLPAADAIVVLSAEGERDAREYGGPSVGSMTLQRIRYAAFLHHRTHLPILTSGGRPGSEREPLATSM